MSVESKGLVLTDLPLGFGSVRCAECGLQAEVVTLVSGFQPRPWAAASVQCERCGKIERIAEARLGEAEAWRTLEQRCDCGGARARDRILFCPSCRSTDLRYERSDAAPLFFRVLSGIGRLQCARCTYSGEVVASAGGSQGRVHAQCQTCGSFCGVRSAADETARCICGGEASRDRIIFCPSCRSVALRYARSGPPQLFLRALGHIGRLICVRCYSEAEIVASSDGLHARDGVQCQGCGKFASVPSGEAELGRCDCGGELSRDCVLFCPSCRSAEVEYRERGRSSCKHLAGVGVLSCELCSWKQEILGSLHGGATNRWASVGMQCQACGRFRAVDFEKVQDPGPCPCGGELSRDLVVFCPACRGTALRYQTSFLT